MYFQCFTMSSSSSYPSSSVGSNTNKLSNCVAAPLPRTAKMVHFEVRKQREEIAANDVECRILSCKEER